MTMRMAITMPEAILGPRPVEFVRAPAAGSLATGWNGLRSRWARWLARKRLSRSIAHLDDRLLADVGFSPDDLGSGERFIRRFAAGASIWAAGERCS
jgi:uncharacterized protein YjiS (DUF1127 family)